MALFNDSKLEKISANQSKSAKYNILLVDDEEDNLLVLKGIFSDEYNVVTAVNGFEALKILENDNDPTWFHLIISDQRMPKMTGVEFLTHTITINPLAVRIILTGYTDVNVIIDAINKGHIYKFILKPYDRNDLLMTVQRALEASELELKNIQLMKSLQTTNKHLQKSNKIKDDFLATIGHELRTPMNAIFGGVQILQREKKESPHLKAPMDLIQSGANEIMGLINDILIHTEIVSGKLTYQTKTVELSQLLDVLVTRYTILCQQKQLRFELEVSDKIAPWVTIDEEKFLTILSKLLDNAVKFTECGSIKLTIETHQKNLICRIEDSGIGIAEESQDDMFEPFRQIETGWKRRFGGLGIGLSICKSLVIAIKGQIRVKSALNEGSLFVVEIPFREGDAQTETNNVERKTTNAPILIIEDNIINQQVMKMMLEKIGLKTLIACHGKEGLEQLENNKISLVLMDLQMPVMDGFTCSKKIRQSESPYRDIPIIAVSANLMDADRNLCIESGMNDFLKKPVKIELLQKSIAQYIDFCTNPMQQAKQS